MPGCIEKIGKEAKLPDLHLRVSKLVDLHWNVVHHILSLAAHCIFKGHSWWILSLKMHGHLCVIKIEGIGKEAEYLVKFFVIRHSMANLLLIHSTSE
ncbi:hypothetical protein Q3G72_001948 [Acer saccharum]|nr:hypothetical protein Q3G72_001948 [Acer saccharum]